MNTIQTNVKITVVTVTYNAEDILEDTILSVINQTHKNIEYIIIDGASIDGTKDIIKKNESNITYWKSEQDNGIYDAMNKAINQATGEWIIFMNAGDCFVDSDVIAKIFREDVNNYDFIYGDMIWKNGKKENLIKAKPLVGMWKSISFSHQSLFSKTSIMKENIFDLNYQIVADYNSYYEGYTRGRRFHYVDFPIAKALAGGISDQSFYKRTYERWSVVRRHSNSTKVNIYYLWLLAKYFLKNTIKRSRS